MTVGKAFVGCAGWLSMVMPMVPSEKPPSASSTCDILKTDNTLVIEPWRARPFKTIKDLVVDRSAFDEIIQAGGYISVSTGGAPEANTIPVPLEDAELAMDAAACIGCGACVAACPNASAMLFVGAKDLSPDPLASGKT